MNTTYDVLGIGNAIVDIITHIDHSFLETHKMIKGSMHLISAEEANHLYEALGQSTIISGGSVSNSIVALSMMGASCALFGKVKEDTFGQVFAHDVRASGVFFPTPFSTHNLTTACSLILVTPDGERTMNTHLGACQTLSIEDIDPNVVESSHVLYLEGYLWDSTPAREAAIAAAHIAKERGRRVALTLSELFCVDRHRDSYRSLIDSQTIGILFANEYELISLYQKSTLRESLECLKAERNLLGVVTLSEKGAIVIHEGQEIAVPAYPVSKVVDTTGAGDLFAAGFLYGLIRDRSYEESARLGALMAGHIIQQIGSRPQSSLQELAHQHMFAL